VQIPVLPHITPGEVCYVHAQGNTQKVVTGSA
jgi:hypothetical protein